MSDNYYRKKEQIALIELQFDLALKTLALSHMEHEF